MYINHGGGEYLYLEFLREHDFLPRLVAVGEKLEAGQHLFDQPPFEWARQLIPPGFFQEEEDEGDGKGRHWYLWMKALLDLRVNPKTLTHYSEVAYSTDKRGRTFNGSELRRELHLAKDLPFELHPIVGFNVLKMLDHNFPFVWQYYNARSGAFSYRGENIGPTGSGNFKADTYAEFLRRATNRGEVRMVDLPSPIITPTGLGVDLVTYPGYGYTFSPYWASQAT